MCGRPCGHQRVSLAVTAPRKENSYSKKRTYTCTKTLQNPAWLAVLFEVIFRLIFQSKIFNYWFFVFLFSLLTTVREFCNHLLFLTN